MAFNPRNFSSGEAAFVSTFTYHSEEDALEDILDPAYFADMGLVFQIRDVARFFEGNGRETPVHYCEAVVSRLDPLGNPTFLPSKASRPLRFPIQDMPSAATQPTDPLPAEPASRRRAA